ncbi:MGDG synthase family glycosyltransferase [Cohnella yongneupensis]|uniref:Glycosyltransferase n=1 Tax=Cohnella yongneupensis TaxID=425006 RepID=A0ABW0QZ34_9BACL
MIRDPSILIVYSTFGDGHLQVANALKQRFASLGYHRVHMVDLFAESHPFLNAISRFAYLKSTVYYPRMYGLSYHWMNKSKPDAAMYGWLHGLGKRKMLELADRLKPDAVIHTFPFLAVSQLNQEAKLNVPTFTVLTDYVPHNRWMHPGTDRYFVATDEVKAMMMQEGVNGSRISVSGIPIRESFRKPLNKCEIEQKYGLESGKNYVLLVAGAYGVLSNLRQLLHTVLKQSNADVLLVCGKNRKLQDRLIHDYRQEGRVRVFGYVNDMEELMSASSCLITKAGGITLTEASALALPVIVYRPLPGQEEGNATSLAKSGALLIARTTDELADHLHRLEEDAYRTRMGNAIRRLCGLDAGASVVTEVLQFVEQFKNVRQRASSAEERQVVHG